MPAHTPSGPGRRLPLLVLGFLAGGLTPLLPAAEPAPSWQAGTATAVEEKIIAKAMELARSVSPAAKSPEAK